jgi:signal transduction histidine kinase
MIRWLLDLSFRQKVPLWGGVLIVSSTLSVASMLVYRTYDDTRTTLIANSASLGHTLARTLVPTLLHDDTWRAFEIVRASAAPGVIDETLQPLAVLVIARDDTVFVSSDPLRYPLLTELALADPTLQSLSAAIAPPHIDPVNIIEPPGSDHYFVAVPIEDGGTRLGTLVLVQSQRALGALFSGAVTQATLLGLLVLSILLPMNWYWGRRTADPLVRLARQMDQIPDRVPDNPEPVDYPYGDELGRLFMAYARMVDALREKALLERGIVASERLAAVGRLTSGIAHEINNPLAGLLTAVDTLKTRSQLDARTHHTLDLIERGLHQIRDTVAALLVEARSQKRDLEAHDIEDVATLLQPVASKAQVRLETHVELARRLPLPAGPVRQILINLVNNALHAASESAQGWVLCAAREQPAALQLRVSNNGAPIPPAQLDHLFEPFVSYREGGHGLGLWVTYQLVEQLHGRIDVSCNDDEVAFTVELPLTAEAAAA